MIWHLYDYYLDAGAGYFATKKACEPLHIQYSYDDRSIVVVNSTYAAGRSIFAPASTCTAWRGRNSTAQRQSSMPADSAQRVFSIPESLYAGAGENSSSSISRLSDAAGHVVSRNFYWVPGTLTTFDWERTDYTHTPALAPRRSDRACALPQASVKRTPRSKAHPMAAKFACILTTHHQRSPFRFEPQRARRPEA